jgi:hypothetical protein
VEDKVRRHNARNKFWRMPSNVNLCVRKSGNEAQKSFAVGIRDSQPSKNEGRATGRPPLQPGEGLNVV